MSGSSGETLIEVSELTLHPDAPALDFKLQTGEALAIRGGNGSGKSRLLASVVGQADFEGRIQVGGHDMDDPAARRLGLKRLGILFQESGLLRDLDVENNIGLPAKIRGRPRGDEAHEETEVLLGLAGCTDARAAYASELSAGESRRIALARCLAGGSDILLLDEPVAGLSSMHRDAVLELLHTLRSEGVISGLIVFTDDHVVASQLAEKEIVLSRRGPIFGIPSPVRFYETSGPSSIS